MQFISTRGGGQPASAPQAILKGLHPDGGLYVPDYFPTISSNDICAMPGETYVRRATRVLGAYLADFGEAELAAMCVDAYARFDSHGVAPIVKLPSGEYVMELWHGPTLAFKDVALTLLPHLLTASARSLGLTEEILILVATSGDTGKAALSGFADVPGTRCAVFYPLGGVSEAQRLQMVTQRGANTHVIAVRGNFDDAQTGVKRIFADTSAAAAFSAQGRTLSSANSINFGRLAPQIAYYFSAYADLMRSGDIAMGEPVNFCVPTGNFGNILAAAYAKSMGLPVGRLICASNRNNVLTDFINTGVYDARREFHLTSSPSMDILISSNLERMLFELCDRDAARLSEWMRLLREQRHYIIDADSRARLQSSLWAGWADDDAVTTEIARAWQEDHYMIDSHTAVASRVLRNYRTQTGDAHPCVIVSTASPFKFGRAVAGALLPNAEGDDFALCRALSELTGAELPQSIAELPSLPVLHSAECDRDEMLQALCGQLT